MGHGLRVAVLGQGSIGRRHAGILRDLGHEVAAYDPAGPAEDGGVDWRPDEDAALAGADAAVVATPSSMHFEHAALALDRGVPALVEKPLTTDAAGARAIEARAADAGGRLAVAMNLRFHPGVAAVRRLVSEGAIGRPLRAGVWFGSWLPGWRPQTDYRRSYSARSDLGGGILLDAIHELDYAIWTLGPVTRVGAALATVSDLEIDVEDVAHVHLEHAGGTLTSVTLDYLDRSYSRGCRIVGDEGTVEWRFDAGTVTHLGPDGPVAEYPAPADVAGTYRAQMERFVEFVRNGGPPAVSVAEARHVLDVADAARRASAEGVVVTVPG
jgi:predicted dehydrogenase